MLILFAVERTGRKPCALAVEDLDRDLILAFLDEQEKKRKNAVQTCNARLRVDHAITMMSVRPHLYAVNNKEHRTISPLPNRAERLALVIGVTGGIGGEVAKALITHGWRVRALARSPEAAKHRASWVGAVEWVSGDAMNEADVVAAANGVAVIFHGANPPGYRNWRGLAIPMLKNAIAAARASGARLIFPGNVYNFGPDAWPLLSETSPQHPQTRKGVIRVEMEAMLWDAAHSGVRSLVVRAVTYPGEPAVGHAWAYLPNFAETIARLADIERSLPPVEVVHFGGHWLESGVEMAKAIGRVAGHLDVKVRPAPWMLFRLVSPFVGFLRELMEMRYLWRVPVRLDNTKLIALLGEEPHSQLDDALRAVLMALGCIPDPLTQSR
jgi:nucleoside-diphosphate-sugar epimerase